MVVAKVASDVSGLVGRPIRVDGRASTGALTHRWDLLGAPTDDVSVALADEAVAIVTATQPGTWVLKLTVSDGAGSSDASLTLVTSVTPTVVLDAPEEVSQYDSFTVSARVPSGLDGSKIVWAVSSPEKVKLRPAPDGGPTTVVVPRLVGDVVVTADVVDGRDEVLATGTATVAVSEPVAEDVSEATYWQEQILADNRAALTTVRATATTWQGMLAGVLGLFGTVTLLGAPSALDEVGSRSLAYLAVALVAGGFLAAVTAVVIVTRIITVGVRIESTPDPRTHGQEVLEAAESATHDLGRSKKLAFGGAALIAAAGLALAMAQLSGASAASSDAPLALVRTTSSTLCGPMSTDPQTGAMSVAGQEVGAARSVEVVDACAAPAEAEPATGLDAVPSYVLGLLVGAAVIGSVLGVAHLWTRRRVAPAVAAAIVYALAWGMSGRAFTGWHLLAVVVAAIAADWLRSRRKDASAATGVAATGQA